MLLWHCLLLSSYTVVLLIIDCLLSIEYCESICLFNPLELLEALIAATMQDNEVFVEKCGRVITPSRERPTKEDWNCFFSCQDCRLKEDIQRILICVECFDKSRHFGHDVRPIVCEDSGHGCDCGNHTTMKSTGFCSRHTATATEGKIRDRNRKSGSAKSENRERKQSSDHNRRGSVEGMSFFDGIRHLFTTKLDHLNKPLDLPQFYDLSKVNKYSSDGILVSKFFERSRAHYLEHELRLKRVFEITKITPNRVPKSETSSSLEQQQKTRMLLWHPVHSDLTKVLEHGLSYENNKMGRALYFRDRIKRFIKYEDKEFGLLLLCEVTLGHMYRVFEKKHFREVPLGFDSLKCVGQYSPDESGNKTMANGVLVPMGKTVSREEENKTQFDVNQFLVLDKRQVALRYLVQYSAHR